MSTRTTKMLGVGIATIAFLLVTIPVLKSGVAYADSGDHDHGDHTEETTETTTTIETTETTTTMMTMIRALDSSDYL